MLDKLRTLSKNPDLSDDQRMFYTSAIYSFEVRRLSVMFVWICYELYMHVTVHIGCPVILAKIQQVGKKNSPGTVQEHISSQVKTITRCMPTFLWFFV